MCDSALSGSGVPPSGVPGSEVPGSEVPGSGGPASGPEDNLAPSRAGTVVLDIGGPIGAAVVRTEARWTGREVEIRPTGAEWDGVHTAIRPRLVPGGTVAAAVFGSLTAGEYQIRLKGEPGSPVVDISVDGGAVTQVQYG